MTTKLLLRKQRGTEQRFHIELLGVSYKTEVAMWIEMVDYGNQHYAYEMLIS